MNDDENIKYKTPESKLSWLGKPLDQFVKIIPRIDNPLKLIAFLAACYSVVVIALVVCRPQWSNRILAGILVVVPILEVIIYRMCVTDSKELQKRLFCIAVLVIIFALLASPFVNGVPPSISVQPQDQTNFAGHDVTFSVTATGTMPLGYQWRHGASANTLTNIVPNYSYSTPTSNSLDIVINRTNVSGLYDCIVTNSYGAVTSSTAILQLHRPASPGGVQPLRAQ